MAVRPKLAIIRHGLSLYCYRLNSVCLLLVWKCSWYDFIWRLISECERCRIKYKRCQESNRHPNLRKYSPWKKRVYEGNASECSTGGVRSAKIKEGARKAQHNRSHNWRHPRRGKTSQDKYLLVDSCLLLLSDESWTR